MMSRTRKYSNIRILLWPNIRIHFFSNESQPIIKRNLFNQNYTVTRIHYMYPCGDGINGVG